MDYPIKISSNDIFDYVMGRSSYDPIERQIDPTRFDASEFAIYDHFLKKSFEQDECYAIFYKRVKELRFIAREIKEIQAVCNELEQMAPTKIYI